MAYPENIQIAEFWIQMKTYVQKVNEKTGSTKYERLNTSYKDDLVDAVVYSYICAKCFAKNPPMDMSAEPKAKKKKVRYVMDSSFNLVLSK